VGPRAVRIYSSAPPVIFAVLFALQGQALAYEPKIGSAAAAKNKVEGLIEGQSEAVSTGSAVFSNETVRTGEASIANLIFLDNTNLSVGPTSEVRLDKFVYDPNGSSGSVVLQASKGAFRFVTGSQDKRAYQVRTPFGSLGVRGTIVEMVLTPCESGVPLSSCGIHLKLVEGGATFTTTSGETLDLSQANTVVTVTGNGDSSRSTQAASLLGFSPGDAGGDTTGSIGGGAGGGGGGTGGSNGQGGGLAGGSFAGITPSFHLSTADTLPNFSIDTAISSSVSPSK
jgi:hypothetical protein